MQARLFSKRCAYCGGPGPGKEALYLDGYEACRSCRTYFLEDPDPERLARVRAYRAERRGSDRLNRLLTFSR